MIWDRSHDGISIQSVISCGLQKVYIFSYNGLESWTREPIILKSKVSPSKWLCASADWGGSLATILCITDCQLHFQLYCITNCQLYHQFFVSPITLYHQLYCITNCIVTPIVLYHQLYFITNCIVSPISPIAPQDPTGCLSPLWFPWPGYFGSWSALSWSALPFSFLSGFQPPFMPCTPGFLQRTFNFQKSDCTGRRYLVCDETNVASVTWYVARQMLQVLPGMW